MLGLCCCAQAFLWLSPVGAYSSLQCTGLLVVTASLVAEHGVLSGRASVVVAGFSSCSSPALEHRLSSGGAHDKFSITNVEFQVFWDIELEVSSWYSDVWA